ncbi:MAG: hypothetical protein Q7V62_04320, partial [Actinomycetota bacterium]|nr:hypothetical protein [Actinomycetota bacterium]
TLAHDATGGQFKLTYGSEATAWLDWNASTAAIETALENLLDVNDVTVTGAGSFANPWAITFNSATMAGSAFRALQLTDALDHDLALDFTAASTIPAGTTLNVSLPDATFTYTTPGGGASASAVATAFAALINNQAYEGGTLTATAVGTKLVLSHSDTVVRLTALVTQGTPLYEAGTIERVSAPDGSVKPNELRVTLAGPVEANSLWSVALPDKSWQVTADASSSPSEIAQALATAINADNGYVNGTLTAEVGGTSEVQRVAITGATGGTFTLSGKLQPAATVTETTAGSATVKEVQRLVLADVGSGDFTLTINGTTTAAITWSATEATLASSIQAALNAAGVLGTGAVTVTSSADNTFNIAFNAFGSKNSIAVTTTSLTGADFTTGAITWAADDTVLLADIQAKLDTAFGGAGKVTVVDASASSAGVFDIKFAKAGGRLQMTEDVTSLTGTGKDVEVTTVTEGTLGDVLILEHSRPDLKIEADVRTTDDSAGRKVSRDTFYVEMKDAYGATIMDDFVSLRGMGLGAGVSLDGTLWNGVRLEGFDNIDVRLGSGDDDVIIKTTLDAGTTTFVLGGGNDEVFVEAINSNTVIMGGAGDDTVTVANAVGLLADINDLLTFDGDMHRESNSIFDPAMAYVPFDATNPNHVAVLDSPLVNKKNIAGTDYLEVQVVMIDQYGYLMQQDMQATDAGSDTRYNNVDVDRTTSQLDNLSPGTGEAQKLVVNASVGATAGSFVLSYKSSPVATAANTAAIAWTADDIVLAQRIQDALNAVLPAGLYVVVTSSTADQFYVRFSDIAAQEPLTANTYTGGVTGVVVTEEAAVVYTNSVQSFGHDTTGGSFRFVYGTEQTAAIAWNATAASVEAALEALTGITDVAVSGTGTLLDPWQVAFASATREGASFL